MRKKILVVAATGHEISGFIKKWNSFIQIDQFLYNLSSLHLNVDVLITSVGMVATAYRLSCVLQKNTYDFVINAGICGSYIPSLKPGTVVHVSEDCFAELGIEGKDVINPLFIKDNEEKIKVEAFVRNAYEIPLKTIQVLPRVKGATVNTVTTSENRKKSIIAQYGAATESMEGAAFLYVCNAFGLPYAQIRSVSNYAGCPEDKTWHFETASQNLCHALQNTLDEIDNLF
ncbi:MAG: Futalosine hydrolase [Bacteroidetes bacterium ADurb.Bin408]|nr:MAG: Futalosine hydrolase [Bacteroidetes bacterium ADurb.Bin408]